MITKKPKSFLKVNNYIPFSPFFFKGFILIIISFLTLSISAEENYVLLNRAADLFQKEKKEIKNYKVKQEVTSTVKESTGIVVEKRIQTGYFQYPDEYIFVCKEIEMNGIKQILAKPLIERINKSEVDKRRIKFSQFSNTLKRCKDSEVSCDSTKNSSWVFSGANLDRPRNCANCKNFKRANYQEKRINEILVRFKL